MYKGDGGVILPPLHRVLTRAYYYIDLLDGSRSGVFITGTRKKLLT